MISAMPIGQLGINMAKFERAVIIQPQSSRNIMKRLSVSTSHGKRHERLFFIFDEQSDKCHFQQVSVSASNTSLTSFVRGRTCGSTVPLSFAYRVIYRFQEFIRHSMFRVSSGGNE